MGCEIFPSYLRVCPRITHVMTFYPHVLILITKISAIFCQTKTGNYHDDSAISAEMLILALFKTLLPLGSVCCCAVWKMVINPFLLFGLGCGKFVLQRSGVLSLSAGGMKNLLNWRIKCIRKCTESIFHGLCFTLLFTNLFPSSH